MQKNYGTKLMTISEVIAVLGTLGSIIIGFWVGSEHDTFTGIVCFVLAFVANYVNAALLAAIGQFTDNSCQILWLMGRMHATKSQPQYEPQSQPEPQPQPQPQSRPQRQTRPRAKAPETVRQPADTNASEEDFLEEIRGLISNDSTEANFCPACGAKQPAGRKTCGRCGTSL